MSDKMTAYHTTGRAVLKDAGGVRSLIEVLMEVGQTDWQLAGMVCKTLWNFSEGYVDQLAGLAHVFGEQEGEELMTILEEFLERGEQMREESHADVPIWEDEFLNVGQHLLGRLKSMTTQFVPLGEPPE